MTVSASPVGVGAVISYTMTDRSENWFILPPGHYQEQNGITHRENENGWLSFLEFPNSINIFMVGNLPSSRITTLSWEFLEDRAISPTWSARVQRWALVLSNYHYQIVYKPGSKISNADWLSRLPVEGYFTPLPCPEEVVLSMSALNLTSVTSQTVAFYTSKDPVLSQVRK